ncbi:hypothetical protein ACNKHW_15875 [Shigella flexneri]
MEGRFRHQDVRSRTASSLANQYHIDSGTGPTGAGYHYPSSRTVAEQQPKLAHPQLEALLRWGRHVHEVGLKIDHSGLHRHSAYSAKQ